MISTHYEDLQQGNRFDFGANWNEFLNSLNETRIIEAEKSLKEMLKVENLEGQTFLDIGSGSGLFSLAAKRLGAKVHSFDYDPKSVQCTLELKRRYFENDDNWQVEEGSALDLSYVETLGKFDIVYSWGVLHHTGNMYQALQNALIPLKEKGKLFIAIYNDQHFTSKVWLKVKKFYCFGPLGKALMCCFFFPLFATQGILLSLARHKNLQGYFQSYKETRGMSVYHDWIDWLGGLPFEVASPEAIFNFYVKQGLSLSNLITTNSLACNQFVFERG